MDGRLGPRSAWTSLRFRQMGGHRRPRGDLGVPRRNASTPLSIAACLRRDSGTKPCFSDTEVRHARDRVARLGAAISRRVGGSDCSVAKFGDEGRCVGGEAAQIRGEAARRSAVGGRGDKSIGMVPKAEVDRLSVSRGARLADRRPVLAGIPSVTPIGCAQGRPQDQVRAPDGRRLSARH